MVLNSLVRFSLIFFFKHFGEKTTTAKAKFRNRCVLTSIMALRMHVQLGTVMLKLLIVDDETTEFHTFGKR